MSPVIPKIQQKMQAAVSTTASNSSAVDAVNALNDLQILVSRLHGKVRQLKQHRSDDPIVQMQTEIISDLYDGMAWVQRILWPTVEQLMTGGVNTDAVRDAAAAAAAAAGAGAKATVGKSPTANALLRRP